MCGIAGIYSPENKDNHPTVVKMGKTLAHRGQDSNFPFISRNLNLNYNRLAIIDLDRGGMAAHGDWNVWLNGCIYNHKELRDGLKEYVFHSNCDTEVIAAGLDKHGINFVSELNGMFAIVAQKREGGDTYLIRDRFGVKPMYYWNDGQDVVFASEIKAILQSNYTKKLNNEAINQWLVFQNNFTDETMFKDIHLLEPGTIYDLRHCTKKKFWDWDFHEKEIEYEEAVFKTRQLLTQAIKRQTIADVKLGAWVSGGIDSNAIANVSKPEYTFTCAYSAPSFDERPFSEIHATVHGSKHFERLITPSDIKRSLQSTIYHLEDLRCGPSYSNFLLYELSSKFVKVLLQGTGGDELFGGYRWRYSGDYGRIINRTNIEPNGFEWRDYVPTVESIYDRYKWDCRTFLQGLFIVSDKLSMAYGIEDRVPFMDNDLVRFAQSIPAEYKYNKKILKDAVQIPTRIKDRPKQGFCSPDKIWFQLHNSAWVRSELTRSTFLLEYTTKQEIKRILDNNTTAGIWSLLALEYWFKNYS